MKLAVQCAREYSHLGYGTFGLNLIRGLEDCGVDVWSPAEGDYAKPCPPGYRTVLWASVPHHGTGQWEGQRSVLFTMWETQNLPPMFSSNMHNYDLVLVPNEQNVELFSEYHPNVRKVQLGYDTSLWQPLDRDDPADTFRFLFCGAGAIEKTRKGADIAINAFLKAFPRWETMSPSPRLVVKCLKFPPDPQPFMVCHVGKIPVVELVNLYQSCHAMVLPSRGEGWGYHPLQAVASGIPAAVSAIPGHLEYADLPGFAQVQVGESKALEFLQGDAGMWWEPDVDSCAQAMGDIYNNYAHWKAAAAKGGRMVRALFSEKVMAENTIAALGVDSLIGCRTGPWEPFTEAEYALEVNRYLSRDECNIGPTSYEFEPGRRYWVPAQVRTSILKAGYCANPHETVRREAA